MAGCGSKPSPAPTISSPTTLTIGLGLAPGESAGAEIPSIVRNLAFEGLVAFHPDGRPDGRIAESWMPAPDGRTIRVKIRHGKFHDGEAITASTIRDILVRRLPGYMGPAFDDVEQIRAVAEDELEFSLKQPSAFLIESLDLAIVKGDESPIGTGPFRPANTNDRADQVEMIAHEGHYAGKPSIDRIVLKSYESVRAAWAELLRGQVDMLYDVGIDGRDSLASSTRVNVFEFQRPYAYTVILNVNTPTLRSANVRRALNNAINRAELISNGLRGRGIPADGGVWPQHWAFNPSSTRFRYEPQMLSGLKFICMFVRGSTNERVALALEQQLRAVGVELVLEPLATDELLDRLNSGKFEATLIDVANGPLVRPYLRWHSAGPQNLGHYSNSAVDKALEAIRHAANDTEYRAGVSAFQDAIVSDPPAIFLAWSERARAVSSRFQVPAEPGRDILTTLRSWRPSADILVAGSN
jgi:peptide/nickel transport system substrate-binding protein